MDEQEHGKRDTAKWLRRILPVVILALGIGGTVALVKSRKKPKRKDGIEQLKSYMNAKGAPVAIWNPLRPRR